MPYVGDASATLPWFFIDEATPWTERLLTRLLEGDTLVVPAHWPVEVGNVMLVAQRKRRIKQGLAIPFFQKLAALDIEIEPPLTTYGMQTVHLLAERHSLTIYDAAYLELAQRRQLPLATLDQELIEAAQRDGSLLVP